MKRLLCVCAVALAVLRAVLPAEASDVGPMAAKRHISLTIDAKAGLYTYVTEVPKGQTATVAGRIQAEMIERIQLATGQEIAAASMKLDGDKYQIAIALKQPGETVLTPSIPGLMAVTWTGNCLVNSHYKSHFEPGQFVKLTKEQREQVERLVVALAAMNHQLPFDAQYERITSKSQIEDAWTLEVVFSPKAFQAQAAAQFLRQLPREPQTAILVPASGG
jgi:hypothetical protein